MDDDDEKELLPIHLILGLADTTGQESNVLGEFKEQLTRSEEWWYETTLPWKPNHQLLLSNRVGTWLSTTIKFSCTETEANGHVS